MTKLKKLVKEFMEERFEDWIGLACDDYEELESYGLEEGDEKDYARERMQEVADDVEDFYSFYVLYDSEERFIGYDKKDIIDTIKAYLTEHGYDVK